MGFFQKRLQLVLQPHPIAPQLVLFARNCPPSTLLGIGHKAQNQFPGHQPLHQAFGIREILGNPSCVPAVRHWTEPAPDATFRLSASRLPASRVAASNTFPAFPTLVSPGCALDQARARIIVNTSALAGIYRLKSAKLCTRIAAIPPMHPRETTLSKLSSVFLY